MAQATARGARPLPRRGAAQATARGARPLPRRGVTPAGLQFPWWLYAGNKVWGSQLAGGDVTYFGVTWDNVYGRPCFLAQLADGSVIRLRTGTGRGFEEFQAGEEG